MLSGFCTTATQMKHKSPADQSAWHERCRGAFSARGPKDIIRCECTCHHGDEVPRDMDAEIKAARLIRELKGEPQPHYPGVTGRPAARADGKCKNNHEMMPDNTGPGNVCRHCKRDASTRHKAKAAERAAVK